MAKDKWAKASEKAKSMGFDLNETAKKRNASKKGTEEYNSAQNLINQAFGVSKRHGESGMTKVKKKIAVLRKGSATAEAQGIGLEYNTKLEKKLKLKPRKHAGDI